MLTVDRTQFSAWCEGVLLSRTTDGGYVAPNEVDCVAAEDALERGETVLLRNGATLTGTEMVLLDGAYCEQHSSDALGRA